MEHSSDFLLVFFAVVILIWLLPLLIIITSGKTNGGEKIAWVLAMIFISWFAFIFYILLAPIKKRN
jgi:hypothetical protein